jgi:hypothetical protein
LRAELSAFRIQYDGIRVDMNRERARILRDAEFGFGIPDKRLVNHFNKTKKSQFVALINEIFEDMGPLDIDLKKRESVVDALEIDLAKADGMIAHFAREVSRLEDIRRNEG